jgi:hypothetical protein
MSDLSNISTRELAKDYLESYMDIARCELMVLYPDKTINRYSGIYRDVDTEDVIDRLKANQRIVSVIRKELRARDDLSLFAKRQLVLGAFSL